ncbi:hypothetical protein ACGF3G_21430 [Streptomyces sp. NPDC048179]|uniref:hypothetical protein n=1 Tax=Streptomyces sp. NPDC048179 TaxID=3365506 RepID=UPI0037151E9E
MTTGPGSDAAAGRAGHAGTCARAGLFAVLGTVLATFGHHAVAGTAVPGRLVVLSTAVQFAAVWPLARRRYAAVATVVFTLGTQGLLHLALSYAEGGGGGSGVGGGGAGGSSGRTMHAMHTVHAMSGDGHAWHRAGTAMTVVHTVAALVVAWLLHRADARMTAALGALRTLGRAAAQALAWVLPRPVVRRRGATASRLPVWRSAPGADDDTLVQEEVLEHTVVRRGPPAGERLQNITGSGVRRSGSSRTGKEFPCVPRVPCVPWNRCPRVPLSLRPPGARRSSAPPC